MSQFTFHPGYDQSTGTFTYGNTVGTAPTGGVLTKSFLPTGTVFILQNPGGGVHKKFESAVDALNYINNTQIDPITGNYTGVTTQGNNMTDAVSKKQNEITKLQQEIQAAGNPPKPGAEPVRYGWGYNRTDNKTFEYGTAYIIGQGDANTDNPVTKRYALGNKNAIANDVRNWLATNNKPHDDWKAATKAYEDFESKKQQLDKAQKELVQLQNKAAADKAAADSMAAADKVVADQAAADKAEADRKAAEQATQQLQDRYKTTISNLVSNPTANVTKSDVSTIDPNMSGTNIAEEAAQAPAQASQYDASTVGTTSQATIPGDMTTSTMTASMSQQGISDAMQAVNPAQGALSPQAIANAARMDPSQTQVGNLQDAQGQAILMNNPVQRQIQQGELISGAADANKAVAFTEQIEAAQATPSEQTMVQNQLAGLMQQFEGGNTPAWAAGAMRAALGKMAARGLGASSLAGQAVVQGAMESALPIAMADARTVSQFEMQNLTNRQQRAMLAAQQRAQFIGQEFDQEFQARVQNAGRIADIANINFTAEQQVALENSRIANSVNLANLSNRQAIVMAEAASIAQLEQQNLSNQQQAAVQNAQAFLQIDMANLSNRQQTALFKGQQIAQSIFTDQAAENAAKQFNASSENQTNQFLANLKNSVSQFNATQTNSINQFNAGQKSAAAQFNASVQNQRDQFNAANKLVIAQANAQWRQNVETINTAAQNAENMETARVANQLTTTMIDQLWQRERDIMDFVFKASETSKERTLELILADKKYDEYAEVRQDNESTAKWSLFTQILLDII